MASPQRQRISLPALALSAVAVAIVLVPARIPALRAGPWDWIVIVLQFIAAVAMVVYVVRFVRTQRDDYWRERGKDPKRPEI